MNMRLTRTTVVFGHDFVLPGFAEALPAGAYDVVAEEEFLHGLSFEAYRCVATYLTVHNTAAHRVELRPISASELEAAQARDRADPGRYALQDGNMAAERP